MSKFITLEQAVSMTGKYRDEKEAILIDLEKGKNILPLSETVDKSQVLTLLNRSECVFMRIYYGMDAEKKVHAVIVGVDAEDRDILPPLAEGINISADDGYIIEDSRRCPPDCPITPSALNL
jgi:hypothetical protein